MPYLDRTGWTATADSVDLGYPSFGSVSGPLAASPFAWLSLAGFPHWYRVDMGALVTFDRIDIGVPYFSHIATTLEVQVSDDDVTWSTVVTVHPPTRGAGTAEQIMIPRQTARYVKLLGVSSTLHTSMSIGAFYLWIEQGFNRYLWTATSDSQVDADHGPQCAVDGYNLENYSNFVSAVGGPQSITVDMHELCTGNYIRVAQAWTRFDPVILWGQVLPTWVQAWTSVDNVTWTLKKEMMWPAYGGTHWIEFPSCEFRHFRLTAIVIGGGYDRLAIAELWSGQLAEGETYKYYLKIHPKKIAVHADVKGSVDYFDFVPDPFTPTDLTLGKIQGEMSVWTTRALALAYPSVSFSDWDLPEDWLSIVIESVSVVAEGAHTNGSGFSAYVEGALATDPFIWGAGGYDWYYSMAAFSPFVAWLMYTPSGWATGWSQATVANIIASLTQWDSGDHDAASHADVDVSLLTITDHYLYAVWQKPYVLPPVIPPVIPPVWPPLGGGTGLNNAMLLIDLSEAAVLPDY